jgi:two-component system osmolarity sensor histidine kinase EnvZ
MTLFPRSLLWRTVLLLALLIAAAHLSWLQIFRISQREPRAQQVAAEISAIVNLTRSALITAQPEKRLKLLLDLSQQEGIQVYSGEPNEAVRPFSNNASAQRIAQELKRRLGADTELMTAVRPARAIWVSFRIDDDQYWVRLARERIERQDTLYWLGWGALILLLALTGAFAIVARINRPLRELTRFAALIGRGQTPPPVVESGPTEIRTLAVAFNQMAADVKRSAEDRALLLAGVSHDLRTPLSRLRLGLEMSGGDAALIQGMHEDIDDIDVIIGQFLDFARAGSEQSLKTETDLNALIDGVVERYRRKDKNVITHLAALPLLTLNAAAMHRLITNLIDNALRHGGPEVEVTTARAGNRARLSVLDRGPGIPSEEAERMLQPFTRLNEARSTSGSGLGLAIVDRIARQHGGRVELLPRAGGGLEAVIDLPID